ncbi:unnamed protein product, partial [Phaeothamnion confervicola]
HCRRVSESQISSGRRRRGGQSRKRGCDGKVAARCAVPWGPQAEADAKLKKKKRKRPIPKLSFGEELTGDDDDGGDGGSGGSAAGVPPKKVGKDPNADTSFLPDREREERVRQERERLRREWLEEQERIKQEKLEVTYSYWDGSGHRRVITITKGTTVGKFLSHVQQQISQDFHELRSVSSDNLLYIKEDLIVPHHYSFYDLIVTKARGKSGPLFHFDVHDDVRLRTDATVEKDESHPGKVVERRWYERYKHIFPASRWEVYDANKDYGTYTIHGHEVN